MAAPGEPSLQGAAPWSLSRRMVDRRRQRAPYTARMQDGDPPNRALQIGWNGDRQEEKEQSQDHELQEAVPVKHSLVEAR